MTRCRQSVRRRLEKALAERDLQETGPFSGRVRRLIVEHLGGTPLTPSTVARALAISGRTLSRRLADEGTSFRGILDDVRREFACGLLQDRSLSVGDVAFFLQVLGARGIPSRVPAVDRPGTWRLQGDTD